MLSSEGLEAKPGTPYHLNQKSAMNLTDALKYSPRSKSQLRKQLWLLLLLSAVVLCEELDSHVWKVKKKKKFLSVHVGLYQLQLEMTWGSVQTLMLELETAVKFVLTQ